MCSLVRTERHIISVPCTWDTDRFLSGLAVEGAMETLKPAECWPMWLQKFVLQNPKAALEIKTIFYCKMRAENVFMSQDM